MTAGEKLRALRGEKTKKHVARDLGISESSYAKYERNERRPKDSQKEKIAKYFGTSVASIFFDDESTISAQT